jgi:hypothetical protein
MDDVREEIRRLQDEWTAAIRARDRDALEHFLGAEYALSSRLGFIDRARWLEIALTRYEIDTWSFEDSRIDVYAGGEVAVSRSRYRQIGRIGDLDLSELFVLTDVWVRRDGRWQVVARHSSVVDEG